MAYEVAIGLDNADEMERLVPQGRTDVGIETARRVYVPYNAYPDGEQFVNLAFNVTPERGDKNALDTQFGLSETVLMSECTMKLYKNDSTWGIFNVNVEYPEVGKNAKRSQYGWSNVIYVIHIINELEV